MRLAATSVLCLVLSAACAYDWEQAGQYGEPGMWSVVKTFELPAYPAASLTKSSQGVTVSEVRVDEKGAVVDVIVLEAPDDAIKQSVRNTLRRWRFEPTVVEGKPIRVRGKITVYFSIKDGVGRVQKAEDRAEELRRSLSGQ